MNYLRAVRYISKMFTQKNRFTIGADQLDIRAADLQQHGPVVFVVHILQISYLISEIFYQKKKKRLLTYSGSA